LIVCQSCLDKDPTLSSVLKKKRLEWYDDHIQRCDGQTVHMKARIKDTKADIKQLAKDKAILIQMRDAIAKDVPVNAEDIPRSKLH
jgi:hypothetical protein